jgi:two-component system, NarL family, nitrate/nitrite response regulator NarL
MPLRCLIVDDNASFLEEAAARLRRDGLEVAGFASNMQEALERAHELQPDLALVDIVLGSESGFEVARRLIEADGATLNVILISTHAEGDFADLIEEAPVAGFVSKSELSRRAIGRLVDGA